MQASATTVRQAIWRRLLWWRFLLFQRHRHGSLALERVAGRPFLVLPGVFNPSLFFTSSFFAENLTRELIPPGATVLEIGTGSGVGAVFAAQWAARVVGVDINPEAVRCARINVLLNRVEDRVEVLEGDLFAPVQERRFDVVLFSPPFYAGEPRDALDRAFRSEGIAERFASRLNSHLAPGGHCLVILSTAGEQDRFLTAFRNNELDIDIAAQRSLSTEELTMFRLSVADKEASVQAAPRARLQRERGNPGW